MTDSADPQNAVRWRALDQTLGEIRPGFADLNSEQLQALVDEAVDAARSQLVKDGFFDAFRPKEAPRHR
jgi:hypothetical protein